MKEIIERAERLGYVNRFFVYSGEQNECYYIQLCLIQKWLMEEKNIVIIIKYTENNEFYAVAYKNHKEELSYDYESYTGALEEGIKKAIEILEK